MSRESITSFAQHLGQGVISFAQHVGQGVVSLANHLWHLVPAWPWSHPRRLAEITREEELKISDNKDGTPSIYKLRMKEEMTLPGKMITKYSFGEPGDFEEKVLLLVGATGTGKSSLINAMVNYIMGVKWEDDFRFKLVIDEHQKHHITAHTFYPVDDSALPYKFTIIDTPGFSDTEGLKRDEEIVKQIEELFSIPPPNSIDRLDGIGFVIQSSLSRLSPTQECTFAYILSRFGEDLSKNIFMMLTFADGQNPPVLQALEDAEITISSKHFKFNNSALFANSKESKQIFDAVFWKMSFQSFEAFFADFADVESVHLDLTKEVFKERDHLQTLLQGLNQQVDKDLDKIEEIRKEEEVYVNKVQDCLDRLDRIALKRDPLLNVEKLELLIDAEKKMARRGWEQRIQYFEDAKHQAEMLSNKKRRLADIAKREELKIQGNKDGTPSVYKLPTKEELTHPKKLIAKQSIGNPGKFQERVLLVVGATGAGKSTLINAMVNYIMGVKWEDDFRFKIAIDNPNVSSSKSQTKCITAYTFYPMDGSPLTYKFTIIDTPGFGDTEGLKRDKLITQQIKEFFSIPPPQGIDHLDGIGFVTQSALARLTPTQEYIFASILSIFGKDLSKNIFVMVTFADGQTPPVLQAIEDAKITNSGKHFKFNNSALFASNKENGESFDTMFWQMGVQSIAAFFADFEEAESVRLDLTKEVLKEREQLETLLEGLNPQITMGLDKIEEMRKEEIVMQQREKEIETNKDFTYEVEFNKPRQVDISGEGRYTTTCLKCNFTCHNDCSFADDNDKYNCCAMNNSGDCTVCSGHCYWNEHKNLPFVWVYETVKETRTSEDLKRKYDIAKKGKVRVKDMLKKLEDDLQDVHNKVLTMIHKAQQCLHRLDEIALKPNPLSSVDHLELLIQSEKQTANPGWSQRIQYYEEAKRHAQMISKVKDVKPTEQEIDEKTTSGQKWYSRFKFW